MAPAIHSSMILELIAQTSVRAGHPSMMAESPFTNYTAGVVIYVFLVVFLVIVLVGGGLLAVNLGMLSKRQDDRKGGRTPGDVGILRNTIWPNEKERTPILPAEEDCDPSMGAQFLSSQPPSHQGPSQMRRADQGVSDEDPEEAA